MQQIYKYNRHIYIYNIPIYIIYDIHIMDINVIDIYIYNRYINIYIYLFRQIDRYPFCTLGKEHTNLPINIVVMPVLPIQTQQVGISFCFLTVVLLVMIESLHFHQFKQSSCLFDWKIGIKIVLLISAQRYSTTCTLFTCNTVVESCNFTFLPNKITYRWLMIAISIKLNKQTISY